MKQYTDSERFIGADKTNQRTDTERLDFWLGSSIDVIRGRFAGRDVFAVTTARERVMPVTEWHHDPRDALDEAMSILAKRTANEQLKEMEGGDVQ